MNPKIIAPSELIINPDGSVFHLHLLPEQLTDRIILVGDPSRVDMVASFFDTRDFEVSSREFHTIGGTYQGKPIMCLSHGIGPDNIDIVVNELDALANIDFNTREVKPEHRTLHMVRIGTSGALQPELKLGTPVIAQKAIGFDGVLNYYAGRNEIADLEFEKAFCNDVNWNPLWAKPYVVDADPHLVDLIGRDDMVRGNTISAVGFYGPQGRELRLPLANPDLNRKIEEFRYADRKVTNYEMESAPLQGLSLLMGHKAMTVCSIIANRMRHDATPNYKTAIHDLIGTVLDRI
ncbi:MAG: nucleoside phosphorylase [Paramuribaculum sp.]|nr:nucleoside phosphorylase [Paramuribaculum sp.]MDE6487974.1 nucleoside phosphorylase [Paramuribaculum sp.]